MTEGLLTTGTPEQTRAAAGRLAAALTEAAMEHCVVIGLRGTLGAGKTTFVQGFVQALPGGEGLYVTSPTYAIMQAYPSKPPVRHLDFYRLDDAEALIHVGFDALLTEPGFTLIEWFERIPEAMPTSWVEIALAEVTPDVREIRLRTHGNLASSLLMKVLHATSP